MCSVPGNSPPARMMYPSQEKFEADPKWCMAAGKRPMKGLVRKQPARMVELASFDLAGCMMNMKYSGYRSATKAPDQLPCSLGVPQRQVLAQAVQSNRESVSKWQAVSDQQKLKTSPVP